MSGARSGAALPSLPVGARTGPREGSGPPTRGRSWSPARGSRSPAQIASLVIGVWWTSNGIGAFLIDPSFATNQGRGSHDVLGLITITANGWHALFHLVPGLLGIAVASRPRPAVIYALIVGGAYIVVGAWGLLAGGSSLGMMAVDAPGDAVHIAEGLLVLLAGLATVALRARWDRSP